MTIGWQEQWRPGLALRGIVQQATAALIAMDAARLEELALCCADLNRERDESGMRAQTASEFRDAGNDLNLLKVVLRETRANLTVLSRLHSIRLREAFFFESSRTSTRAEAETEPFGRWIGRERTADYGDN
jgi:hypothetical protein